MTEPIPINDLTFGIELEVIMPRNSNGDAGRYELAQRMTDEGIVCEHESYNHRTRPHWKIVTDASIGHSDAEVVSPILRGDDGFEQVRKVCRALAAHGCRVNSSTGFHVHVGARDRFADQIGFFKELFATYAKYEPIIDGLVSRSRRSDCEWCRKIVYTPAAAHATNIQELYRAMGGGHWPPSSRTSVAYRKINLEAFAIHGTVEFRQHQGTTNAQKIENWVKLCLRIVAHAAKNTERVGGTAPQQRSANTHRMSFVDITGIAPVITSRTNLHRQRHIDILTAAALRGDWALITRYDEVIRGVDTYARLIRNWRARLLNMRERIDNGRQTTLAITEPTPEAPAAQRPGTDAAPMTLDGLLDLIAATESERAYFTERHMELN